VNGGDGADNGAGGAGSADGDGGAEMPTGGADVLGGGGDSGGTELEGENGVRNVCAGISEAAEGFQGDYVAGGEVAAGDRGGRIEECGCATSGQDCDLGGVERWTLREIFLPRRRENSVEKSFSCSESEFCSVRMGRTVCGPTDLLHSTKGPLAGSVPTTSNFLHPMTADVPPIVVGLLL